MEYYFVHKEHAGNGKLDIAPLSGKAEMGRILYSLRRMPFYQSHNYQVFLPEFIKKNPLLRQYANTILVPSSDETYAAGVTVLERARPKIEKGIQRLRQYQHWGFNEPDTYRLGVTKYGVGGSYDDKTAIIIQNVRFILKSDRDPAQVPLHEIVHMYVEHLIEKFGLFHGEKELIVDRISMLTFPDILPNYDPQLQRFHEWRKIFEYINNQTIDNLSATLHNYVSDFPRPNSKLISQQGFLLGSK